MSILYRGIKDLFQYKVNRIVAAVTIYSSIYFEAIYGLVKCNKTSQNEFYMNYFPIFVASWTLQPHKEENPFIAFWAFCRKAVAHFGNRNWRNVSTIKYLISIILFRVKLIFFHWNSYCSSSVILFKICFMY